MEEADIAEKLKKQPRAIRHFNYSRLGERSYHCELINKETSGALKRKAQYIKTMFAGAHGVQLGHLRIYFSDQVPIGLFHPDIGSICIDNIFGRKTAYHLNRVNRDDDKRLSIEVYYNILNDMIKKETKQMIPLYIPLINDYILNTKLIYKGEGDSYIVSTGAW